MPASLLDPDYQFGTSPLPGASGPPTDLLGLGQLQVTPQDQNTDQGAALGQTYQMISDAMAKARDQWPSVEEQRGLLAPLPGWQGTAVDAAKQWADAIMMGTTAPGEVPGFSLEKVQRRQSAPPNEHIWQIKDPAGGNAGTIDTTWNPDSGNLHIEDFQSEGGPNTLGPAAVRQLRSALLEQYPGVQSLSGLRISGATYAHKNSGTGPGRYASQATQTQSNANE